MTHFTSIEHFMSRTAIIRVGLVGALVALHLTSAWASPQRTVTVPITLARTVHLAPHVSPTRVDTDFAATHVAFSWRGPLTSGIRYRVWLRSGDVSEWRRVPEVHGPPAAERLHKHFSAVMAVDDAVAVDWLPAGAGATGVHDVILDYLNTMDGPRREVVLPSVADAAANEPNIVTRAQWGADESLKRKSGGCSRRFFKLQQIFVHHTAGENYDQHPKSTMRAIYWFHVVRQGWCDLGYNFVIAPDGTLFEGRWARHYRPWERHDSENAEHGVVQGAHVEGFNSGSLGVSLMGNYSQVELPPAARRTLVQLLAWETDRHHLSPQGKHVFRNPDTGRSKTLHFISGHRDAGQTACPGSNVYSQLPSLRREVAAVQAQGKDASFLKLAATPRHVTYGDGATFEGTLTDRGGAPLVARSIGSYYREDNRRWKRGPNATTDAEGNFSLEIPAERNVRVIAMFEGDGTYWGGQSDLKKAIVAPLITLEAEDGTFDAGGVSHYPSGTESVILSGSVTPAHTKQEVLVKISRLGDDGSYEPLVTLTAPLDDSSSYSATFAIPDEAGGTYRAVAVFLKDEDHGYARSDPITFVVDP